MRTILGRKILHEDFAEKALYSNQTFLRIGAALGVVVELFNMARVLFFTNGVKLSTLNNRIYFGFYLAYFILCASFLIFDMGFRLSLKRRYWIHLVSASAMLCWHLLFNMYDVYRASAVGYFTIVTVIFFFSGFLMFKPVYTITSISMCYVVFVLFLKLTFSSGEVINFSITAGLCIAMYLIRYKHLSIEIFQAKQIEEVQQELVDTQRDFRLTIEQYQLIQEQESSITFEWNMKDGWIRFSKEWKNYFDEPEEISNFYEYIKGLKKISPEHKKDLITSMKNIRKGIEYQKYEIILPIKTGENRYFEVRVITQTNEKNEPAFGIGMLSDITDRKEKISQLEAEIQMDLFTGLLNKLAIERCGEKKLAKLQSGEKLAALILDMDDFKDINDHYGHPVGDYVLKEVAAIMRQTAPMGTKIGRIGGDEFIALFSSNDLEAFEKYARTLVKKVSEIQWKGTDVSASCSIGLAVVSYAGESYSELYRRTDKALYQAKRMGKNRIYGNLSEVN